MDSDTLRKSEVNTMAPNTLLIPSLLDDHLPLLQYALASDRWQPVLLTEDRGLADLGLRYIHSEMCYPSHLIAGQILAALGSGKYDPHTCGVLIGQMGDECRGSCLIRLLRKALDRAGYQQVRLLSLNVRDIDRKDGLVIRPAMVWQALAGAVWGDALAILRDQTRPMEAVPGAAQSLRRQWVEELGRELQAGAPSRKSILRRVEDMAASFRALETVERPVQDIAIVGEFYTKNCRLGNWDLKDYLAANHCRAATGGLTWQALYYMDSHALKGPAAQRAFYRAARSCTAGVQREMLDILNQAGFRTLPPLAELKRQAAGLAPLNVTVADGWLIAAEAVGWAALGYRKILCIQPFACLPGHIFGKGQYPQLQRKLPQVRLVSVDYDASTGEGTVQSRIRMLLDEELS